MNADTCDAEKNDDNFENVDKSGTESNFGETIYRKSTKNVNNVTCVGNDGDVIAKTDAQFKFDVQVSNEAQFKSDPQVESDKSDSEEEEELIIMTADAQEFSDLDDDIVNADVVTVCKNVEKEVKKEVECQDTTTSAEDSNEVAKLKVQWNIKSGF